MDTCTFLVRKLVDICSIYTHIHESDGNIVRSCQNFLFLNFKFEEYMSKSDEACNVKWYQTPYTISHINQYSLWKKSPHFMETKGSLLCTEVPTPSTCIKPISSRRISLQYILILSPLDVYIFQVLSSFQVVYQNVARMYLSHVCYNPHPSHPN